MKGLRIICIFALVALLVLGSVGTVFAKGGPAADKPVKDPKSQGEKQGFNGNVTDVVNGNVTIDAEGKGSVILALTDDARYKIPSVMNQWNDYDAFINALGGNLVALEGRKVVALAGNDSGIWKVLQFMVLPAPGTEPMHAHRVGNVTEFNKPAPENGWLGNITIIDVHSATHTFGVGNETVYRPKAKDLGIGNITIGSFVTAVITGKEKTEVLPVAKAIVLHAAYRPVD
jgi:hypothetical protein